MLYTSTSSLTVTVGGCAGAAGWAGGVWSGARIGVLLGPGRGPGGAGVAHPSGTLPPQFVLGPGFASSLVVPLAKPSALILPV
ncbi:MAG: hypothetical protein QOE48_6198 [Mycobacterium sp.]|jgi:hypothetical protein|nr:hypothetical protein [Mycobacterium sp.]